jgi:hypothetical protein
MILIKNIEIGLKIYYNSVNEFFGRKEKINDLF